MRKHLQLKDDEGVPASLLFIMACMAAVSVANIYYCQPLLSLMGNDLGIDEWRASLIAMITQVGYACGLFFIIPSGDKFDRKKIVSYSFSILTIALLCIALSNNFHAVMAASFAVGACSVIPTGEKRRQRGPYRFGVTYRHSRFARNKRTGRRMAGLAFDVRYRCHCHVIMYAHRMAYHALHRKQLYRLVQEIDAFLIRPYTRIQTSAYLCPTGSLCIRLVPCIMGFSYV